MRRVLILFALLLMMGCFASPASATVRDIGGQYGWTTPFSTPNDKAVFVRTQGRCAAGHSGQMSFLDGGGGTLFGPVNVPNTWYFADGYGFHVPAGLPAGDYTVYVDCGDNNQIWIAQWITGPGTAALFLDYVSGVLPNTTTPPTVAAAAPSADDSGISVTNSAGGSASKSTSRAARATTPPAPIAAAPSVAPETTSTTQVIVAAAETVAPSTTTPERMAVSTVSHESERSPLPLAIASGAAVAGGTGLMVLRLRRRPVG